MKVILTFIIVSLSVVVSFQTLACSFSQGYTIGQPYTKFMKSTGAYPKAPKINEFNIQRGHDDGNYASCSDAGILTIVLGVSSDISIKSYELKIVGGEFPDTVIPDSFIVPVKLGDDKIGFRFVWLDMPIGTKQLDPIDATLEIRQLTFGNRLSRATTFYVEHPGISD